MKPKFTSVLIIGILLISVFSVLYAIPTAKASSFGNANIFEDKTLLPEEIYAAKFTLTENAAVSNISWYAGEDGYSGLMAAALYNDSGGSIDTLLGYTESVAIPSEMAWVTGSSITWEEPEYALNLTAGDYWLGVKTNTTCFISLHMTDEPENGFCDNESLGFPDFPATFSPAYYNDFSMAIFANYSLASSLYNVTCLNWSVAEHGVLDILVDGVSSLSAAGPDSGSLPFVTGSEFVNLVVVPDAGYSANLTVDGVVYTGGSNPFNRDFYMENANKTVIVNFTLILYPETLNFNPFWQFLFAGDLLGFSTALFLNTFGFMDLVVGTICMLFLVPIYLRTKSLLLVAVIWIMLGGFFITQMPTVSGLAVVFMVLAVSSIIWRLVHPT